MSSDHGLHATAPVKKEKAKVLDTAPDALWHLAILVGIILALLYALFYAFGNLAGLR